MIAPNAFMGMNPNQSGAMSRVRPAPLPVLPPTEPAPNPIVSLPAAIETPSTPTIPASASVSSPATTSTATDPFSSFMAWLTEETVWTGVPNGAVLAGGAVGAAMLFGGGKRRR